jgi:hypothetical protein
MHIYVYNLNDFNGEDEMIFIGLYSIIILSMTGMIIGLIIAACNALTAEKTLGKLIKDTGRLSKHSFMQFSFQQSARF